MEESWKGKETEDAFEKIIAMMSRGISDGWGSGGENSRTKRPVCAGVVRSGR